MEQLYVYGFLIGRGTTWMYTGTYIGVARRLNGKN